MNRLLFLCVLALGCGRSKLDEELPGEMTPVSQREAPLFVFTQGPCPRTGSESDLNVTTSGERLILVKTQSQQECSGAGGDYLVGRELDSTRDHFVGTHACWFLPRTLADDRQHFWGVARVSQTAALFHAPKDWCITQLDGTTEVTSDSVVRAWGLYPDEQAARAALASLRSEP